MKKIILLTAVLFGFAAAAQAQTTVQGSKAFDNMSITLKGGAVSPFQHYAFFKNARGIFGLEVRKQVTPVLGLGLEGEWTINTSSWNDYRTPWAPFGGKSVNWFDHQFVGAFGAFNLSNLFGGYKGAPRFVEVEAVAGAGWLHAYQHGVDNSDENSWYTKYGVNFNFNLGESKAWTISLKPSVLWDMNGCKDNANVERDMNRKVNAGRNVQTSRYNANNALVEMEVGVTYHFKNSNGEHYMTLCPYRYSQEDIDVLNGKINDLRNQLSKAQADLNAANARADQLARDLEECKKLKNKVVEIDKTGEQLMTNVFFKVNSTEITRDQQPNVERVAIYLKNHKDATVEIKGYASPEGPVDNNIRLANGRAASVKDMLVKKYGIKANRINAEGQGIGNMFSELEWNRVSVCTINDDKK